MFQKISSLSKKLLGLLPAAAPFVLTSCSDSEIHSSSIPKVTQTIFVVSEFADEPYKNNTYAPGEDFYINLNEKVRIWGIYAIDGEYIPTSLSGAYYASHQWTIDDKVSTSSYIFTSFDKAGLHKVSFETVDNMGDTLRSYANIYVSTPTSVSLQSPSNGYNQVDGDNEKGLELSWIMHGVDSWESSTCTLYDNYNADEIWQSPLGETDCSNSIELVGGLDMEYINDTLKIDHTVDNTTIYWGIRATTANKYGFAEQAFSEVFSFSTKLKNDGKALIEVPVVSQFCQYPEKTKLNGAFISAAGDTLLKFHDINTNTVIQQTLPPQSNMTIVICDTNRSEYGCSSMTVDLAPSTKMMTDTLFLQDKIKPNMVPAKTEFSADEKIKFYVLDNGSGINASKIVTIMDDDTLHAAFDDYTLSFTNRCKSECNLIINAEDYARNRAPGVLWKIKVDKDVVFITGPFSLLEVM